MLLIICLPDSLEISNGSLIADRSAPLQNHHIHVCAIGCIGEWAIVQSVSTTSLVIEGRTNH